MRRAGALGAVLLVALAGAALARAELERRGEVIVSFDGGISPRALPRGEPAPVAVRVEGGFRSAQEPAPPQLRRISIAINRAGKIFDRGLPTCRVRRIQPATPRAARRVCGAAIVGEGRVRVRVELPNQPPFAFAGPMLVFNAKRSGGKRRLLAQVYARKPPSAFVLHFKLLRVRKGTFGYLIRTSLPKPARRWAYVTYFEMRLHRTYAHAGRRRSFISAACAAPAGFPGAVYPFARASFGFAGGTRVTSTLVRECRVRG